MWVNLRTWPALALALMLWTAQGMAAELKSAEGFFDQTWGNLQEELQNARDQGKKGIFLFFEMDECPFCARMKHTVFNRPEVHGYYKENFLIFPIDIEGDTEVTGFDGEVMPSKDFAAKVYRVRATPVMMFFDLEGEQLYRHTGPTGDAEEFLWLGEYVLSGKHQDMRFSQFRREKRKSGE